MLSQFKKVAGSQQNINFGASFSSNGGVATTINTVSKLVANQLITNGVTNIETVNLKEIIIRVEGAKDLDMEIIDRIASKVNERWLSVEERADIKNAISNNFAEYSELKGSMTFQNRNGVWVDVNSILDKSKKTCIIPSANNHSTLPQYIISQWFQKKIWSNKYDLIFHVDLREIRQFHYELPQEKLQLTDLIWHSCFSRCSLKIDRKKFDSYIRELNKEQILILLSDELHESHKEQHDNSLLKKNHRIDEVIGSVLKEASEFNAVSYTHLTLPTNREV